MTTFKPVGPSITIACLLAIAGIGRSQESFAFNDAHPGVMLSEASYESLLERVETLEASVGEGRDNGWEDVSNEGWSHVVGSARVPWNWPRVGLIWI